MAIVTPTNKQWNKFFKPSPPIHKKRSKRGRRVAFTFRKIGKALQNRHGPGRKTRSLKNAGVTHLHSNKLR